MHIYVRALIGKIGMQASATQEPLQVFPVQVEDGAIYVKFS